jgi:deoxyribonuclease-4
LPLSVGLPRVAERAAEIGASALQLFSDNPTAWRRRAGPPADSSAFRGRLTELNIDPIAIHAAYLVNLAGPDDELFARSVEVMRSELAVAPEFGARYVNVHAGSHRGSGTQAGIARLVDGLERSLAGSPSGSGAPTILLENSSGGGNNMASTIEELATVLDAAEARGLDGRIGVCLDTAHLWGAGYDISTPAGIDALLLEFEERIGLARLLLIHFNDSHSALGSRHDRHAHLGDGRIGTAGMAHLLCHPALDHVTFVLETPDMEGGFDQVNMARIGDLAAGRPLTPAPEIDAGSKTPRPPAKGPLRATEPNLSAGRESIDRQPFGRP